MFKISLIPLPYKILIGLVLLAAMSGLAYRQGYQFADKAWQLKDAIRITADDKAKRQASELKQQQARQQANQIAALDAAYQQEIDHAKNENERLRRDIRAGAIRLYAKSTSPAGLAISSTAASGANAAAICELDPATADDIISITNDGDAAIEQLSGLQAYIKTLLQF
ncbi:lysis system i-spanin subunit Rz [Deefgea piscis]|uniref:lysis system i-spanin subunit Rz n=1 Tax=Deefgea piscis TaxID=2739061 RepID=UPI001C7EA59C|nr:lysis system i-spanin subunit Rz [Deefgea piscis]QZA80174.1 lysis protein [Deefgea piscis]